MKKTLNVFIVIWLLALVIFNVLAFVPAACGGIIEFTPAFFIGYSLITLTFIGQLICGIIAFSDMDKKQTFYNLSYVSTSYIGLVISIIAGGICMCVAAIPYWVGIVLCTVVLIVNIILLLCTRTAVGIVSEIDSNIKNNTFFIRNLGQQAALLIPMAKNIRMQNLCNGVYDALRYSDPVSHDALNSIEDEIGYNFTVFSGAVEADDLNAAQCASQNLLPLIAKRNNMCRMVK